MTQPTPPAPRFLPDEPGTARILENRRLTPEQAGEVRHLVLDVSGLEMPYLEGQSLGILIPPLPDRGHASKLRFYSIASSRWGDDGTGQTLSLCVKRASLIDPLTGEEHTSAASEYLCGLEVGETISIAGPFGNTLLMPEDPEAHLILMAIGTGIAPFRGFLKRAFGSFEPWRGEIHLFFGVKSRGDCLYRDEFDALAQRHANFHPHYALSAEELTATGERLHLHDRVAEEVDTLWALLDHPESYLYLCGKKGMEEPIERLLEERAHRDKVSWRAFHRMLIETGRLRAETY